MTVLPVAPTDGGERGHAQDDGGDDGDDVGLEQVGGHPGAVAHVVADVVGDGGRVAGVVLGDPGLDLADQVGADVGRLGEDAATDPHEQGEQRGAEAEADQDRGGRVLEDEDDDGGAEQAEPDAEQSGDGPGPECDLEGAGHLSVTRGRRRAHVAPHGQAHADEAGQPRAQGPAQEADHPVEPGLPEPQVDDGLPVGTGMGHLGGGEEDKDGQGDDDDQDGLELTGQEGLGPLLDGLGDVLHRSGALVGGEDPPGQEEGGDDRGQGRHQGASKRIFSVDPRKKAWYPPSARRWIIGAAPFASYSS